MTDAFAVSACYHVGATSTDSINEGVAGDKGGGTANVPDRENVQLLGAVVVQRALDQAQRLAEVQSLTQDQLAALRATMQNPAGQRKVAQHFDAYGKEFQGMNLESS